MRKREWDPTKRRANTAKPAPGRRRHASERPRFRAERDPNEPVILYGWHTVKAALENPARHIRKLWATQNAARRLQDDGVKLPIVPEPVRPDAIVARLGPEAVHQGLLAEADALDAPPIEDIADGIVLVLDQITDPHNVGAIFRSAAAFGVSAIVTTARHSPQASGVLAKSASGALEYVPLVSVQNLSRGLASLRDNGFALVGLDSSAERTLADLPLAAPLALVLGAEGKGLRQLTRASCDHVARLDLPGKINSLNVSNAAALALHIATTRIGAAS